MFEFFKGLGPMIRSEIEAANRATGVIQTEDRYESNSDMGFPKNCDHSDQTTADIAHGENGDSQGKNKKQLLSKTTRVVIVAMGILFMISQLTTVFSLRRSDLDVAMQILMYGKAILLSADVIATFIFLRRPGRKAELLAIAGVVVFIVVQYLSTALMVCV